MIKPVDAAIAEIAMPASWSSDYLTGRAQRSWLESFEQVKQIMILTVSIHSIAKEIFIRSYGSRIDEEAQEVEEQCGEE